MSFTSLLTLVSLACSAILFAAYSAYYKAMRPYWTKTMTGLEELKTLADPRQEGAKLKGTVVIAGGSVAGLATARMCTDHFENVIVIEPETWLHTEEGVTVPERTSKNVGKGDDNYNAPSHKRARVPQWALHHWYQAYSTMVMRKFFGADYDKEIIKDGGRVGPADYNMTTDNYKTPAPWTEYDGRIPDSVFVTRRVYETVLRRLVRATCPTIQFVNGSVTGINPKADNHSQIESVNVKLADQTEVKYDSTLFIDCAGPTHVGLKWLREAGYGEVADAKDLPKGKLTLSNPESLVKYDPKMSYSTTEWRIDEESAEKINIPGGFSRANYVWQYGPIPKRDNLSLIVGRLEKDYVQISCGGYGDYHLPINPEEVLDHLDKCNPSRKFPEWFRPMVEQIVRNKDADEGTYGLLRVPQCTLVKYEQIVNLPSNFVAVGDSIMRVNPVFAQGCNKALLGVVSLDSLLRGTQGDIPANFSERYFEAHALKTMPVWRSVKAKDYGWKSTVPLPGETHKIGGFSRWYNEQVARVSTVDKKVASAAWHVRMFLSPPTDMMEPSIFLRVLGHTLVTPIN